MASRTEIANYALALVAEQKVADITDESNGPQAKWADLLFDQSLKEVLRSHIWSCARKRQAITADSAAPDFGWAKSYTLPADYVRIVTLNNVDPDDVDKPFFEIEDHKLLTDETTCNLVYIYLVDPGKLDALAAEALYTLLASKLAWALQQNRTLRLQLLEEYQAILSRAMHIDSFERQSPAVSRRRMSSWIPARYSSTNG